MSPRDASHARRREGATPTAAATATACFRCCCAGRCATDCDGTDEERHRGKEEEKSDGQHTLPRSESRDMSSVQGALHRSAAHHTRCVARRNMSLALSCVGVSHRPPLPPFSSASLSCVSPVSAVECECAAGWSGAESSGVAGGRPKEGRSGRLLLGFAAAFASIRATQIKCDLAIPSHCNRASCMHCARVQRGASARVASPTQPQLRLIMPSAASSRSFRRSQAREC